VTIGVAIGVPVGDLVVMVLGTGAWQMALVVVLAMGVAVVLSSAQLLVIQAGVQSVFIVAFVATQDAALSRWLDAVVGGVLALVIGAVAPTSPVLRPRAEAARTVREVSSTLRDVVAAPRRTARMLADAALDQSRPGGPARRAAHRCVGGGGRRQAVALPPQPRAVGPRGVRPRRAPRPLRAQPAGARPPGVRRDHPT
jgi:uncharacterized membrane protein YccC